MKKIMVLTLMALAFGATELQAQTYVGGYTELKALENQSA